MDLKEMTEQINFLIKDLAGLITIEISIAETDKLVIHHATNAIKSLTNLNSKLQKRLE